MQRYTGRRLIVREMEKHRALRIWTDGTLSSVRMQRADAYSTSSYPAAAMSLRTSHGEEIKAYRISIGDDALDDFRSRLRNRRWPEAELVDDWSQGAPMDQGGLPLLGRRVQVTPARSTAQPLCAIHCGDRRARHSFPARSLTASGRDAADHYPWLAEIGGRVSQGDRNL
jgi:hypothetical protein